MTRSPASSRTGTLLTGVTLARRKIVATFAIGGLSLEISACSGDAPAPLTPSVSESAATEPSPSTDSPDGYNVEYTVAEVAFTGPAVDQFGQEQVQDAYRELTLFTQDTTFRNELVVPRTYTVEDFTLPEGTLTPRATETWDQSVQGALEGTTDDITAVQALCFYNVSAEGFAFHEDGPKVVNPSISNARAEVDTTADQPRLAITMDVRGEFRMLQHEAPVLFPQSKTITYSLAQSSTPEPSAAQSWQIDHWSASYVTTAPIPDDAAS